MSGWVATSSLRGLLDPQKSVAISRAFRQADPEDPMAFQAIWERVNTIAECDQPLQILLRQKTITYAKGTLRKLKDITTHFNTLSDSGIYASYLGKQPQVGKTCLSYKKAVYAYYKNYALSPKEYALFSAQLPQDMPQKVAAIAQILDNLVPKGNFLSYLGLLKQTEFYQGELRYLNSTVEILSRGMTTFQNNLEKIKGWQTRLSIEQARSKRVQIFEKNKKALTTELEAASQKLSRLISVPKKPIESTAELDSLLEEIASLNRCHTQLYTLQTRALDTQKQVENALFPLTLSPLAGTGLEAIDFTAVIHSNQQLLQQKVMKPLRALRTLCTRLEEGLQEEPPPPLLQSAADCDHTLLFNVLLSRYPKITTQKELDALHAFSSSQIFSTLNEQQKDALEIAQREAFVRITKVPQPAVKNPAPVPKAPEKSLWTCFWEWLSALFYRCIA